MSSSSPAPHPLSGDGGVALPTTDIRDPFEILDDLMQVVEALCPTWPERDLFPDTGGFKL
jgi:hypothetical protein